MDVEHPDSLTRSSFYPAYSPTVYTLNSEEPVLTSASMSGAAAALLEMIENMNHGGRISMLGLPAEEFGIDWGKVVTHMLTLKGIYGREMFEIWNAMAAMLQTSATSASASARSSPTRSPLATGRRVSQPRNRRALAKSFSIGRSCNVRSIHDHLRAELDGIAEAGLTKNERGILGPQGPETPSARVTS